MKNQSSTILQSYSLFSPENTYALIFDNIEDNFLLVDTNLNIVFANKSAKKAFTERLGVVIVPGINVLTLVEPERVELLKNVYHDVLRGNCRTTELHFTNEDGSLAYFENQFRPAISSENEIVGVVVSSTDITEKKKREQALREAEERWRFALEGSNQGVWDWDLSTGKVVYSQAYYNMYGYEPGDLQNSISDWLERVHPDDREKLKAKSQQSHTLSQPEATYRIRTKQGDYKWILAKGTVIRNADGEPVRIIGVHTDLTEKFETEEELKRSTEEIRIANERFNIMLKATHDMIWDWDIINDHFYRGEEGLKKVFGVQHNESVQTFKQWLSRIHPEDMAKVQCLINEVMQGAEKDTFDIEYRFLRDDGTYSYVYDRSLVIRDDDGLPIRMIGAAQDISERKNLERDLLQKELEYRKYINQATVDSQEQERSEIGKELHDNVNQVLTTTKLYLDLALSSNDMKDELIRRSILNVSNAISEIRQLSRSLMDPTIYDLGIVDSIKDLIENINLAKKTFVSFEVDASIENLMSKNQKLAIFRIIQEALNNVIRHAKASNVKVLLFYNDEDICELTVEDNGVGFDTSLLKKGAGLKNIQNRVYLINGDHNIQSSTGRGCKILIKFPLYTNFT